MRGGNGQYPNETLFFSTVRPEITRVTRALLCTLLGVKSEDTITNHVDKLLKRGVIDNTKNLVLLKSEHGRETTLYDLKVFNYLVMRLDTDQAWEKKEKHSDESSETYQTKQVPIVGGFS